MKPRILTLVLSMLLLVLIGVYLTARSNTDAAETTSTEVNYLPVVQNTTASTMPIESTVPAGETTVPAETTIPTEIPVSTPTSTPPGNTNIFFVAPNGTAQGDGSSDKPWSLARALRQPAAVQPGATIWMRGGTYTGMFRSLLQGTADAPITLRQVPGERATIDGSLYIAMLGRSTGVLKLQTQA